jgi:trypsin
VLGAEAGADGSGLAFVAHAQGSLVCSGALIAPTLVLTAKHCVFASGSPGDTPLPVSGFRVGFGPSRDELAQRGVDDLQWVGAPAGLSVASGVVAGEDVAVLHLTAPAPSDEKVRDVSLAYAPTNAQPVRVGGYGVSDLATGANGTRGIGFGQVAGYDPGTGIIEVVGAGACFGDSGGPVLSADGEVVLGVLSELGSVDGGFCNAALSFADTAANLPVQRLVAKACASVGGCGPGVGAARDAAVESAPESVPMDGSSEAAERPEAEAPSPQSDGGSPQMGAGRRPSPGAGCTCANVGDDVRLGWPPLLVLFGLRYARGAGWAARRRRRCFREPGVRAHASVGSVATPGQDGVGNLLASVLGAAMIEPKDPNDTGGGKGSDTDPVPSGTHQRFRSSRPRAVAEEPTLTNLLHVVAHCDHPKESHSPAVVLEPDGSRKWIRWCGACGAMDVVGEGIGDWIRPGAAQILGGADLLTRLANGIAARVERLTALSKAVDAVRTRLSDGVGSQYAELLANLDELESACEELARFARTALGDSAA